MTVRIPGSRAGRLVPLGRCAVGVVVAVALAGCGSPKPVDVVAFRAEPPARDAGQYADFKFTGADPANVHTWRQKVVPGDRIALTVTLRNVTHDMVVITGLGTFDPSREMLWRPDGVENAPVTIPPGANRDVTLLGHAACPDGYREAAYTTSSTRLKTNHGTQLLDFRAILSLSCS